MNHSSADSIKQVVELRPTMEQFNKYHEQGLQCSIDNNSPAVPLGAKQYLDRHGCMIIKNLCDPEELFHPIVVKKEENNFDKEQLNQFGHFLNKDLSDKCSIRYNYSKYKLIHSKIQIILEDIIGEKLHSNYCYDIFHFKGHEVIKHKNNDPNEIIVCVQVSTNLNSSWPFYIDTSDDEENFISLKDGWAVVYKGFEKSTWRRPFDSRHGKFKQLFNKIIRKKDDTYYHQVFFHYTKANINN